MSRQELIEKAISMAEQDIEIVMFNTAEEIRFMAESAPTEALMEFVKSHEEDEEWE